MKIAICDDEISELSEIRQLVQKYDSSLSVTEFSSAASLLKAFDTCFFDLVFLDIEMEHPNGFEVAQQLMAQPDTPLIVLVTKCSSYTIRGYGVAFRYLMKPVDYDTFHSVMTAAIEKITPKKLSFFNSGLATIFSIKDIQYIEVFNYILKIHTAETVFQTRASLKDIEEKLSLCGFARPHNSFLVNLDYIQNVVFSQNNIILKNGNQISISRGRKREFETALQRYLRG